MPRFIVYLAIVSTLLALLLLALAAKSRHSKSELPRVHIIQDMDNQPRFKAQMYTTLFADGRAMRPPIPGTVAQGHLNADEHFHAGRIGDAWATEFPSAANFPVAMQTGAGLVQRGQERYQIFCAPCHAADGSGMGSVTVRAQRSKQPWVLPANLTSELVRERSVGHLYNTITNGYGNMGPYSAQIPVADRWAIVAYVRALQRTVTGTLADVKDHPDPRISGKYADLQRRLGDGPSD